FPDKGRSDPDLSGGRWRGAGWLPASAGLLRRGDLGLPLGLGGIYLVLWDGHLGPHQGTHAFQDVGVHPRVGGALQGLLGANGQQFRISGAGTNEQDAACPLRGKSGGSHTDLFHVISGLFRRNALSGGGVRARWSPPWGSAIPR